MTRVKVTLSDEEKTAIEKEARESGMSMSKYIRQCLQERHHHADPISFPFNREDLKTEGMNMYIRIPKGMNDTIRNAARERGMSKSDYIVYLLTSKGQPVEINVDLPSKQMYTADLFNLLNEVLSILDVGMQTNVIYGAEMNAVVNNLKTAAMKFTKAADRKDRDLMKQIDQFRNEILEGNSLKGGTNGNRKDDSDSQ